MDKLAERLKAYIEAHPFGSDDRDCESVLEQIYRAYKHKTFIDSVQYGAHLIPEPDK